ncbi:MAG TPA: M20 family metallopeptidase [Gemmatimonadaceae bacterium]|nr:M20 family metallopeptidase [Gemmatimonadaceae bacterium]
MTTLQSMDVPPELRKRLVELRRSIHEEPELAFEEERTANKLESALRDAGITDVRRVARTAVIGRVRGSRKGAPTIALRGDIDALPITEETGLPFASRTAGVMHACGHDVHATWAVGAGALLAANPAVGDVLIVLQPAEETGRGAAAVLESGALDGTTAIFGGHVDRRFPVGQVVADAGPLAASADTFEIELVGHGAHAARPHEARDPIVAAAALVTAIQTIVARRLNPATPGVVTVGQISAGNAPNVIPDRATLRGTIRAVDPSSRSLMMEELRRIAEQIGAAHGVAASVNMPEGTPPLVNPENTVAWSREAVSRVLGRDALVPLGFLNLAGEDFAYYMERMPGCFLRIGAREPGGAPIPAHSPRFYPAEESIFVGAAVLAECARVAAERSA